ncbi:MAG: lipid A export permease/ATP-binding protein MsbA [Gammaproteobacteria bacterium]|nr:lipid A export permease/ATP-binding protein MsbA [Gammaproteobacteria bacterium]
MRLYRRLLAYAWPYKWTFLLAVAGMIVLSATAAGFTALMKPLMDEGFVQRDPSAIKIIPPLIVLMFLARGIGNFLAQYGTAWIGRRVTFDLRANLFQRMLYLPSRYYESSASGGLISRLIYDVEQVAAGVTQVPYVVIGDGLTMLALAAWLLYLNWKLTLVFVVLLPVTTLLLRAMNRRFLRTSLEIQTSMGEISQVVREASDGQRVVKAFGGQAAEMLAFAHGNEKNRRQSLRKVAVSAIGMGLLQFAGSIALGLVIYTALLAGEISAGTFTSYIIAAMWIMGPSRRLARVNETVQTTLAATQSIFAMLDEAPEEESGSVTIERARGRVEYRHVGFRYPNAEQDVLNDVSFTVEPGQVLALVGQSGSGKSTIVSLLPRFYRAARGTIRLDDTDINDLTLASLRRQIALVGQENILFDDSIRHNIAYGEEGAIDENRLMEAARAAYVLEFADRLPEGLNTHVGERGALLSGGQRQRIAIARALYKNAPILILDEATSALDTESERFVQAALQKLMEHRTTLVIAHRLSTVEHADRIVVLAHGCVVESGSHRELLARNGVYAGLYRNQFRDNPTG